MTEKHEEERELLHLLRELVRLQEEQICLLRLIHQRQQAIYPATSGGSVSVS